MAHIVMDALGHQAIREAGTEASAYGMPAESAGRWRGKRLQGFRQMLSDGGHTIEISLPTPDVLAAADLLVVPSRSQLLPYAPDDLKAIGSFVANGGRLMILGNHRGMVLPQQQLAAALKLPFTFANASIGGDPQIALLTHAVTTDVTALAVRNACWLQAGPGSEVLARFAVEAQPFALGSAGPAGRVLAIADSGFMASLDDAGRAMFESADNARFFANAVAWLLQSD
ncbi:DUF4350 domain-containing protein [Devosia sp.]|uniref:DUF4350 domain-containing protein n=1 Tax=Devosia sp. TaxID=1871048 RepID=UPI003A93F289